MQINYDNTSNMGKAKNKKTNKTKQTNKQTNKQKQKTKQNKQSIKRKQISSPSIMTTSKMRKRKQNLIFYSLN